MKILPTLSEVKQLAKTKKYDAIKLAPTMEKDQVIVITISGRGDKDCAPIARYRGEDIHE